MLRVKAQNGQEHRFRIKRSSPIRKLIGRTASGRTLSVGPSTSSSQTRRQRLPEAQTPAMLRMLDGDVIDVLNAIDVEVPLPDEEAAAREAGLDPSLVGQRVRIVGLEGVLQRLNGRVGRVMRLARVVQARTYAVFIIGVAGRDADDTHPHVRHGGMDGRTYPIQPRNVICGSRPTCRRRRWRRRWAPHGLVRRRRRRRRRSHRRRRHRRRRRWRRRSSPSRILNACSTAASACAGRGTMQFTRAWSRSTTR